MDLGRGRTFHLEPHRPGKRSEEHFAIKVCCPTVYKDPDSYTPSLGPSSCRRLPSFSLNSPIIRELHYNPGSSSQWTAKILHFRVDTYRFYCISRPSLCLPEHLAPAAGCCPPLPDLAQKSPLPGNPPGPKDIMSFFLLSRSAPRSSS